MFSEILIYGDESGSLINTSATRQDIRYLRTIQQFTDILSLGLEDVFKDYLTMVGVDLSKLILKVKFAQINSEEALQKMEFEQTRQEALDRTINSLKNLGIEFVNGAYKQTRDELIKRFMDQDLLDLITKDEEEMSKNPPVTPEDEPTDEDTDLEPLPAGSASDFTDDFDAPLPDEDIDLDTVEPETLPEVEPSGDTDVNDNPPYSLG